MIKSSFTQLIFLFCFLHTVNAMAAQIQGIVLDAASNPVSGAKVWLEQNWEARFTETDTKGAYAFNNVHVAVTNLCALKEGYAIAGFSGFVVGDATIDLHLATPVNLGMKIVDRDYKSVPGSRIRMLVVNDQFTIPVDELLDSGFPPLRADDASILTIPFVPDGGFVKFAASHFQFRDAVVNYLPPREKMHQIIMYSGTKIQGQITHNGKGLPHARVLIFTLGANGQNLFTQTFADNEGLYGLRLASGRYHIAVRHPDFASPKPLEFEVQEKDEALIHNLEMRTPFVLNGAVHYPDASGCGGARVQYRFENVIYEETFSDNDGGFQMKIPKNKGELFIIPPQGYQTTKLPVISLQLEDTKRNINLSPIQLERLPEIRGTVLDPDGQPLSKVMITVSNLTYPVYTQTNGDGTFSIMLDAVMEEAVAVRFEHAQRFYRKDFIVEFKNPDLGAFKLEEFKPDQEQRDPITGQNDLDGLVGKKAQDLECAQWFNSEPLALKDFKGKTIILNFWAGFDTSPLGISRLQELQTIQSLYADESDVVILGIHDASSEADEVKAYIENYGLTYPIGLDKEPYVTFEQYRANFIPQTVLIDKKGKVQYYQVDGRLLELIKILRRR